MSPLPERVNTRPDSPVSVSMKRSRGDDVKAATSRRLFPSFPVGDLGQLIDLPGDRTMTASLEMAGQLHGGWGSVVFSVEEAVTLASPSVGEREGPPAFALTLECGFPSPLVRERFLQGALGLLVRTCEAAAHEAIVAKEALSVPSDLAGQACLVMAIPVFENGKVAAVICRVYDPAQRGEAAPLAALQVIGLLRVMSALRKKNRLMRSRFGKVAAFVELLAASEGGIDFAECTRRLANHLGETLECDLVALSVSNWGRQRLAAVSGEAGPSEAHSPGRRALLTHLTEAVHRGQPLLSRRKTVGPQAHGSETTGLREWFDPAVSLCLPLIDSDGRTRGGWLFLWNAEPNDFEEKRSLISAASPEVAPLLSLLNKAKPGPALGGFLRMWKRGTAYQRRAAMVVGIGLVGAMLVPFPYPIRATCELQPVVRRVIAAPFDGVLQRSTVRAGDVVEEGQLLAELDGREIRSQLSEALAKKGRATKESDTAMAGGHVAESRIAGLEAEGLGHQVELLEYRQRHLEVRSPIAGLVLQGDLERSEGAPLRVGDALFEVGPLDRLVAEVAVPATDVSLVTAGAKVRLKLESYVNSTVESVILRVAPKSEWVDDRNVFICEAEIENPGGSLRAGLKGRGKVDGPRRPLLWILCRDAWLALRYHFW